MNEYLVRGYNGEGYVIVEADNYVEAASQGAVQLEVDPGQGATVSVALLQPVDFVISWQEWKEENA